jgi:hypothetical protein
MMKRLFIPTFILTRVTKAPTQRAQLSKANTNAAEFTTCEKRNLYAGMGKITSDPPNHLTHQQLRQRLEVNATHIGTTNPFVA